MRRVILLLLLFSLIGCHKPIGQYQESEFIWKEKEFKTNYQEIYRKINDGFRNCSSSYLSGVPQGNLYTDIKKGHFDTYYQGYWGTKINRPMGMIDVTENSQGNTIVRVGSLDRLSEKAARMWLDFAEGKYTCKPED